MKDSLNSFITTAQNYTRNPLGIIGLFIVLVYGIAALLFSKTASSLEFCLKVPLVYFMVLFPCMVLWIFFDLVKNHHQKLYGPQDFREDKSFLDTFIKRLSPEEKIKSLEEENAEKVEAVSKENGEDIYTDKTEAQNKEESGKNRIFPELNSMNGKSKESRKPASKATLIMKALRAEESVIRLFSNTFDIKFERNVRLRSLERYSEFDGLGIKDETLVAIEVKYTSDGIIPDSMIAKQITKFHSVYSNLSKFPKIKNFTAILVVVKEDDIDFQIFPSERIDKLLGKLQFPLRIIEYKYSELKEIYK